MGRADFLRLGDWNVQCYRCGFKRKASEMRKQWQGYYVCPEHWEMRQPQDFVKSVPENIAPPWSQPMPADDYLYFCNPTAQTAIPGYAYPGCAIPGFISLSFDPDFGVPDGTYD